MPEETSTNASLMTCESEGVGAKVELDEEITSMVESESLESEDASEGVAEVPV